MTLIKKNFERASKTYCHNDIVQKKAASYLANQIRNINPDFYPNLTLDVGCGTGNMTNELYKIFPNSKYHINDLTNSMLDEANKQLANKVDLTMLHGDIANVKLEYDYDLIASNMCLQWVGDLSMVLHKLQKKTNILAFSCLLDGSFKEWYELLEEHEIKHVGRSYPSQKDIKNIFDELNKITVYSSNKIFSVSCQNAKESANYFKNIGANSPNYLDINFGKSYKFLKRYDKPCNLVYNIGFFVIGGLL